MGISGAFDILGDGEIVSLAELATKHYERHRRPLRIAVDEAGWRFNNLTEMQVAIIRRKEPAANPIEKAILYRILKLLRLNLQLLFVFDGPKRPWKRGKAAGRVDWKVVRLLKQLLSHLGVPYHTAPAEAEAECASLQQAGVVDAVWSEDSDALMFGASLLIRDYRPKNQAKKKSDSHVRLYRSETILREKGIDRQGWVLFAMLSGGDYDVKGVRGCGANTACRAAHWKRGLAKLLWETPENRLGIVRDDVVEFLRNKDVEIPLDWPRALPLKNYKHPVVSEPDKLANLYMLRNGWDLPVDHERLRTMLRDNFNFWTKGYIKLVGPVLLTRILQEKTLGCDGSGISPAFGIKLVWPKRKKVQGTTKGDGPAVTPEDPPSLERKITFLPLTKKLTPFDHTVQPPEEDWSLLETKTHGNYDPNAPVECEIMECLLRRHLPESAFEPPPEPAPKSAKKRKRIEDEGGAAEGAAGAAPKQTQPRKRKQAVAPDTGDAELQEAPRASAALAPRPKSKRPAVAIETPVFKFPEPGSYQAFTRSTPAGTGPVTHIARAGAASSNNSASSNPVPAQPRGWALPPLQDDWEMDELLERMNVEMAGAADMIGEEDELEVLWAGRRSNSRPLAAPSLSRAGPAPVRGSVGSQSSTPRPGPSKLSRSSDARPLAPSGFSATPRAVVVDLLSDSDDEVVAPASKNLARRCGSVVRSASATRFARDATTELVVDASITTVSNSVPLPSRACASTLDRLLANAKQTHEQEVGADEQRIREDDEPPIVSPSRPNRFPKPPLRNTENADGYRAQPVQSVDDDELLVLTPPRVNRFPQPTKTNARDTDGYRAHPTQIADDDDDEPLVLSPTRPNGQLQPQIDDEPLFCTPPPEARAAPIHSAEDYLSGTRPPSTRLPRANTPNPPAMPVPARSPPRMSISPVRRPPPRPAASRAPGRTGELSVRVAGTVGAASASSLASIGGVEVLDLTSD